MADFYAFNIGDSIIGTRVQDSCFNAVIPNPFGLSKDGEWI
jgi:hypothetical protein